MAACIGVGDGRAWDSIDSHPIGPGVRLPALFTQAFRERERNRAFVM